MHSRLKSTAIIFAVLILLGGLGAGCSGGGDQSGGNQDKASNTASKDQGGKTTKKKSLDTKTALGTVGNVKTDAKKFTIKASKDQGDEKPMIFKVKEGDKVKVPTKITLDGKKAELADMKTGQQAKVEYVQKKKRNRARVVQLSSQGGGEKSSGGGETTG